jgi:hypothetical protein
MRKQSRPGFVCPPPEARYSRRWKGTNFRVADRIAKESLVVRRQEPSHEDIGYARKMANIRAGM